MASLPASGSSRAVGTSHISAGGKLCETLLVGTTSQFLDIRHLRLAQGRNRAPGDWQRGASDASDAVIGAAVRAGMFGNAPALGQLVRIDERRFRIVGVLAPSGQGLGLNMDELVIVPVALAQAMFNSNTLFRILVEANSRASIPAAKAQVEAILMVRHDGEQDVTVITQDAVLTTFDRLIGALTLGVSGIAAISPAVAGILVMNVMLVAVTQRTGEIGLLKTIGAIDATIGALFLVEAIMLSILGAAAGYALRQGGAALIRHLHPVFPAQAPDWAVAAGLAIALVTGLLPGSMPARRAPRGAARPGAGAGRSLRAIRSHQACCWPTPSTSPCARSSRSACAAC